MRILHLTQALALLEAVLAFPATTALSVQIKEYDVPTPNSRPHDPAVGSDGPLWTTAQGCVSGLPSHSRPDSRGRLSLRELVAQPAQTFTRFIQGLSPLAKGESDLLGAVASVVIEA
jgi:hypothetical protein